MSSYLQSQFVFVFIYAIVGVALDDLDGLHRPGLARSRGIPRHRRLYDGLSAIEGGAVRRRRPASISISICRGSAPANCGSHTLATFSGPACSPASSVPSSAFPALRLHGIYLLIATISFAFIVEEILARWESVTHGNEGLRVRTLQAWGVEVPTNHISFYYLCLRGACPSSSSARST